MGPPKARGWGPVCSLRANMSGIGTSFLHSGKEIAPAKKYSLPMGRREYQLNSDFANQSVVKLVRWTVVSPIYQGSNPGARIIPGFISGFPAIRFQWEETFPSTTRRLR